MLLGVQAASEALKIYYLDGLRYQLNEQASPLMSQLEKTTRGVVGGKIRMALRYGRHGGVGNRPDDGDLPTPNPRKTKQAEFDTKNLFARIQITDKTIEVSKSDRGAFANLLTQELEDAENDAKELMARQLFGNGTGKLCTVIAVNSDAKRLTVDNVDYLAEGQFIDSYTAGGTLHDSRMEITGIDEDNNYVFVDTVSSTTANDILVINGNYNQELTGLDAIVNNTVLYNIDRSTNHWLKAKIINVNGELSETIMQQGIDFAEKRAGAKINFIGCSYGVRRAYQYLLQSQKRQVNTLQLKGGWEALEYAGGSQVKVGIVADKYCPPNTMYMLDTTDFAIYQVADWDWLDKHGAVLFPVSGKAAYEAVLRKYCDLGCSRPRGVVVLTGITEH